MWWWLWRSPMRTALGCFHSWEFYNLIYTALKNDVQLNLLYNYSFNTSNQKRHFCRTVVFNLFEGAVHFWNFRISATHLEFSKYPENFLKKSDILREYLEDRIIIKYIFEMLACVFEQLMILIMIPDQTKGLKNILMLIIETIWNFERYLLGDVIRNSLE